LSDIISLASVLTSSSLDGQHNMLKLALGGITVAPLPANLSSVLDLGCGTGSWSRPFSEIHPEAQILGVDVAPPASNDALVPKNCKFIKANVEDDWEFAESQSYDFIFARLLITALKDWPRLFSRIYENLRPGGMFEHYEGIAIFGSDIETALEDSAMKRWYEEMRKFVRARGLDPEAALTLTPVLQECGFEVIYDRKVNLYLDPEVAISHGVLNGAEVAREVMRDIRALVVNMTEKVFTSEAQRSLAADALQDVEKNSGSRGYYVMK
jgi:SAM-dependent methyltransferase